MDGAILAQAHPMEMDLEAAIEGCDSDHHGESHNISNSHSNSNGNSNSNSNSNGNSNSNSNNDCFGSLTHRNHSETNGALGVPPLKTRRSLSRVHSKDRVSTTENSASSSTTTVTRDADNTANENVMSLRSTDVINLRIPSHPNASCTDERSVKQQQQQQRPPEDSFGGSSIAGGRPVLPWMKELSLRRSSSGRRMVHQSSNSSLLLQRDESSKNRFFTKGHMRSHVHILLISIFIFLILSGAGISLYFVISHAHNRQVQEAVLDMAKDTGDWFSKELDFAILPLFSMAQFASELSIFNNLPNQIGAAGSPNSLPVWNKTDSMNKTRFYRNVTGVCDDPELVERFESIAASVKANAKMDGVVHSLQYAPEGVICLVYPLNNTEDFADGRYLDNTGALGVDLLTDPFHRFIALDSLTQEEGLSIVGPRQLLQCPDCGLYFIVRLPVQSRTHFINVNGIDYPRWGFATALINWDAIVSRGDIIERFRSVGYEYQLTRTDQIYNATSDTYNTTKVVIATSDNFGSKAKKSWKQVTTALQTTNNEWVIVVQYETETVAHYLVVIVVPCLALFIAILVYIVLVQKQAHTAMLGVAQVEKGKAELERNLTAALAHELRNPLGAIDSALKTMPDDLSPDVKELIASMQLCSSFMASIMNNLLDSRKLAEGKMTLLSNPLSLSQLLQTVHKMMLPTVNKGVTLIVDTSKIGEERDWVYGDASRLQQVLTNLVR
jgi:hypothetical protein